MNLEVVLNLLEFYKQNKTSISDVQKVYLPHLNLLKDKGWRGKVLEKMLYVENKNTLTDFEDCELKSVPIEISSNGEVKIKETTSIIVINPEDLLRYDFENSDFYKKIKKILFVLINNDNNTIFGYKYIDFSEDKYLSLINEIKIDYLDIANHIMDNIEIGEKLTNNFTGKIGKWIQPRPKFYKSDGYGYAFFFKKNLLKEILNV